MFFFLNLITPIIKTKIIFYNWYSNNEAASYHRTHFCTKISQTIQINVTERSKPRPKMRKN